LTKKLLNLHQVHFIKLQPPSRRKISLFSFFRKKIPNLMNFLMEFYQRCTLGSLQQNKIFLRKTLSDEKISYFDACKNLLIFSFLELLCSSTPTKSLCSHFHARLNWKVSLLRIVLKKLKKRNFSSKKVFILFT
jgi:hypothetical protein